MGDKMSENVINGINEGFKVNLGKEAAMELEDSYESIIFLFYNDNLVMMFDSKKKIWKFPSGEKEKHESALECAIRETFEKTGAILENAFPVGYYNTIKDEVVFKTAIYFGKVERFETRPEWCEAELVKLFDKLPQDVQDSKIYSIILDYIKSR